MDSEKHWLIQHSAILQSKVDSLEKQLESSEFRFNLLDSIDKSREKEKDLIELHLNRIKSNEALLVQKLNLLDQERVQNKQIIRKVEEKCLEEAKAKSEEFEKINRENLYLKEKIIINENLIEELKGQINGLQEKFLQLGQENVNFETKKISAFEKQLGEKSLKIQDLTKKVEELKESNEKLEKSASKIDNEKKKLLDKICEADELQLEQIHKVLNGEDLYRESNYRLKVLMEEYEKKFPVILEQKKNYERLIKDHQELRFELAQKTDELNLKLEELTQLKNENAELESLKEKNIYLSNQLIQVLSNSPSIPSEDYSSAPYLIGKALDYGEIFNNQEKIIEKLKQENQYLKSRPVLIEEPSPSTEKFLYLESLYQKTNENNLILKKKLEDLQILNSDLSAKLSISLENEENLKNLLKSSKSEKTHSKGQIIQSSSPNLPSSFPLESLTQTQDFHSNYLSEYKSEIKRLQNENSSLLSTIRSHKTVLFENIQIFKSKIESLISEKAEIFIESQKLKSRILDLEQSLQASQKSLQALQESSSKPKLDIKEFAAINELHECRIEISKNSELIKTLQNENSMLKSENQVLHEEIEKFSLKQPTDSQISQLADLTQENFIAKSSISLLQERIKSLVSINLNLEDRVCALDKEVNLRALAETQVLPSSEQEVLNSVKSVDLEEKIKQLVQENKKKDDQITNLMKILAQSQDLPSVLTKIVTVVHRLSKT